MKSTNLTEADVDSAVRQLSRSERGRVALRGVLAMLDQGGLGLDQTNKQAVLTLLCSAFYDWSDYTHQVVRAAMGRATP